MTFTSRLSASWERSNSLLCIGLDPDPKRMPRRFTNMSQGVYEFCRTIVDATADLVCAFKPQIAYFAAAGVENQLERLCDYLHEKHPHVPIVLDAKRGDIGPTAEQYAAEAFERFQADAVTVNPYMGSDSIAPFLAYEEHGVFVLCRTSNPGGGDLQDLVLANGERLYESVARRAAAEWNAHSRCGLVVGGTVPAELENVRRIAGDMPLLVPGIGAQGGDVAAIVRAGCTRNGTGLLISSSRAILYAQSDETRGEDHATAARRVAMETRRAINAARAN